ncbi:cell division protein ZapA [Paucilactobacillus kaifaensis]|uniref:cell division protein ZapA n=1 Tax=Paucilactobacillus kaifaensis TaxID=2559921 RepID=UPI0010F498A2|nr:cell division protein ZapA [Paucilactobacillus kaifaensis]
MSNNKRYKIKIDGEEYTIAGPGSQKEVLAAQQLVNEQIDHLKEVNPELSALQRANLVAFNAVADQISKQQEINQINGSESGQ